MKVKGDRFGAHAGAAGEETRLEWPCTETLARALLHGLRRLSLHLLLCPAGPASQTEAFPALPAAPHLARCKCRARVPGHHVPGDSTDWTLMSPTINGGQEFRSGADVLLASVMDCMCKSPEFLQGTQVDPNPQCDGAGR